MSNRPAISFRDVELRYAAEGKHMPAVEALSALSLDIAPGEPVALIGPSGCGKSTALQLIAGLIKPTSGVVTVSGEPVTKPRQATAYIPQDLGLLPWKTVIKNAELGLRLRDVPAEEARAAAERALEFVGIGEFANGEHVPGLVAQAEAGQVGSVDLQVRAKMPCERDHVSAGHSQPMDQDHG